MATSPDMNMGDAFLTSDQKLLMMSLDPKRKYFVDEEQADERERGTEAYNRMVSEKTYDPKTQASIGSGDMTGGFLPLAALAGVVGPMIVRGIHSIIKSSSGSGISAPNGRGTTASGVVAPNIRSYYDANKARFNKIDKRMEQEIKEGTPHSLFSGLRNTLKHEYKGAGAAFTNFKGKNLDAFADRMANKHIPASFIRHMESNGAESAAHSKAPGSHALSIAHWATDKLLKKSTSANQAEKVKKALTEEVAKNPHEYHNTATGEGFISDALAKAKSLIKKIVPVALPALKHLISPGVDAAMNAFGISDKKTNEAISDVLKKGFDGVNNWAQDKVKGWGDEGPELEEPVEKKAHTRGRGTWERTFKIRLL